jgi:hypothetical protein
MNLKWSLIIECIKIFKLFLWIKYCSSSVRLFPWLKRHFITWQHLFCTASTADTEIPRTSRHDASWDDSLPLVPAGPATDLQPSLQFILRRAFFCLVSFISRLPLWIYLLGHGYMSIRSGMSHVWATVYISVFPVASSQFIYSCRFHEGSTHCSLTLKL